ncbi:pickpocket protein 28-like isoform X2 [Pectinophora gossypiella]|uniref:pickpocket protein 28-like isoform X2 n=1 Tax=Pectinophora gossypiella TaxID=13191 RepID=UPI00214F28AD|nr:pickpocket protein 28-like isoform X2 [Pectinophora gossypiella]
MYVAPNYTQNSTSYHRKKTFSCKKSLQWLYRPIMKICRDFCLETSMHGFNHIAARRRHWLERVLWAVVTAAAIWGAVDISLGQWQRYNDNPTVVTLEKDFRTWRFSYPGITACNQNRVKPTAVPEVIMRTWNVTPTHDKYDYYSRFVTAVANSDLFNLKAFEEFKHDESLNVDLFRIAVDVMPDMAFKTTWSQEVEAEWIPVMTEVGVCYSTNSLAVADMAIVKPNPNDTKLYPITCKYSSMICYLVLEVSSNCSFYIHSPYDVMEASSQVSRVILTMQRLTSLSVMETRSGKGVRELAPARRGCRYTAEPATDYATIFSTNTCRLTCRSKLAIKLCGCKPFYYFYEAGPTCTPAGMACLASLTARLATNDGARCVCPQQCVDALFKEISTDDQFWVKGPFVNHGSVRFVMQPPRTRYTREIVFHFQDLVVSFGGAAGLFLGASFISFVEIFYFVMERAVRLCGIEGAKDEENMQKETSNKQVPFEMTRMMALNTVLEKERKYESRRRENMY